MENEIKNKQINNVETIKQHRRVNIKLFLFTLLYWSSCTILMIFLDNKGIVDKYFAWWIGTAMMAIYGKIFDIISHS